MRQITTIAIIHDDAQLTGGSNEGLSEADQVRMPSLAADMIHGLYFSEHELFLLPFEVLEVHVLCDKMLLRLLAEHEHRMTKGALADFPDFRISPLLHSGMT